jgi:putative glutamine amidotransferase
VSAVPRPVIGITAGVEEMTSGPWVEDTAGVPAHYVQAVQRAGARALLLAPDAADAAEPGALLDTIDGLILTGAAGDVDPRAYGAKPHPETHAVAAERDAYELSLAPAAVAKGIPVLGICRGFHVLNVAFGGTLHQHLPDVLGHDEHRGGEPGHYTEHQVLLQPDSLASGAAGGERITVRSYHHQAADRIGEGFVASGWSAIDGDLVEAVERPGGAFCLGVLWHPEEDPQSSVIAALVEAAGGAG